MGSRYDGEEAVDECVGLLTWCAWKLENLSPLSESVASRISHDPLRLMDGQLSDTIGSGSKWKLTRVDVLIDVHIW